MSYNLDYYPDQYNGWSGPMFFGISSGGVVYRKKMDNVEVLLLVRHRQNQTNYNLPKGTVRIGETLEDAAVREIMEESGASVHLRTYLGAILPTGQKGKDGADYIKTNHYYAAEFVEFTNMMDDEHEMREWFEIDTAIALCRESNDFKNEAEILERLRVFLK